MIASEFIRVKRSRTEILAFLYDPTLPERLLYLLEKQYGVALGVSGCVAGQAVASAIDEVLGLTTDLQYSDLDCFTPFPYQEGRGTGSRRQRYVMHIPKTFANVHFKAWVVEQFPHLPPARLQRALTDTELLMRFANLAGEHSQRCERQLSQLLSASTDSFAEYATMSGLDVREGLAPTHPQNYPQVFHLSNNQIITSAYRIVGVTDNGPEQSIHYLTMRGNLQGQTPYLTSREMLEAHQIVSGFDLNSVAVGISLKDTKLVFTPEYVDFLVNREIKIVSSATPLQSVVRAMKKQQAQAGFFNKAYNLKVMRYALLYAGSEPLGLTKPVSYVNGSSYRLYADYHRARFAGISPEPARKAYAAFMSECALPKGFLNSDYKHRGLLLLHSKAVASVVTTTERVNCLNDENKALLCSVVDLITDPSNKYLMPIVRDTDNIDYDCLIDARQGYEAASLVESSDVIKLSPGSLNIWQNIDWGFRFKALRPSLREKIKRLCSTVGAIALNENPSDPQLATQCNTFSKLRPIGLFGLGATDVIWHALHGKLPEKLNQFAEQPLKAYVNMGEARTHWIIRHLKEHWFSEDNLEMRTVSELNSHTAFLQRLIGTFTKLERQFEAALKVLGVSNKIQTSAVFPYLEQLWNRLPDSQGYGTIMDNIQRYYASNATLTHQLYIEAQHIHTDNCATFWNKTEEFNAYKAQYASGWGLLEKFITAWLGVGFTHLLHQASNVLEDTLKTDYLNFKDPAVAESIQGLVDSMSQSTGTVIRDVSITELIRRSELVQEGQEMHHCVGGYSTYVAERRSFIIRYSAKIADLLTQNVEFVGPPHLHFKEERATAEWYLDGTSDTQKFDLMQIRQAYNNGPHPFLRALDQHLRTLNIPTAELPPTKLSENGLTFMQKVNNIGQVQELDHED